MRPCRRRSRPCSGCWTSCPTTAPSARSTRPTPPADHGGAQARAAAREPGAAVAAGVRGCTWIGCRDAQALLDSLIEDLRRPALLLLVNLHPVPGAAGAAKPTITQLRLDPLPPADAEAILDALLGPDASLARSSGCSLSARRAIRFSSRERAHPGQDRRAAGRAGRLSGWPGPAQNIQIPATVQAVLAAATMVLAEEKRLLQAAAVIGAETLAPDRGHRRVPQWPCIAAWRTSRRPSSSMRPASFRSVPTPSSILTQQVALVSLSSGAPAAVPSAAGAGVGRASGDGGDPARAAGASLLRRRAWPRPAVAYWSGEGARRSERSAMLEAIRHFTRGLEILQDLRTRPSAQHRLRLQTVLASGYIAVKGQGAWEVEQAYSRAYALCQQAGDTPQLIPVLQGLRRFYTARASTSGCVRSGTAAPAGPASAARSLRKGHLAGDSSCGPSASCTRRVAHLEQSRCGPASSTAL